MSLVIFVMCLSRFFVAYLYMYVYIYIYIYTCVSLFCESDTRWAVLQYRILLDRNSKCANESLRLSSCASLISWPSAVIFTTYLCSTINIQIIMIIINKELIHKTKKITKKRKERLHDHLLHRRHAHSGSCVAPCTTARASVHRYHYYDYHY